MNSHPHRRRGLIASALGVARTYLLISFTTILYCSTVFGGLYTLENAYYLVDKWAAIQELLRDRGYIDNERANQASESVKSALRSIHRRSRTAPLLAERERERLDREVYGHLESLLESSPVITRIEVEGHDGVLLYHVGDPGRLRAQHDFSNSLLTRSFERDFKRTYELDDQTYLGTLRIYITTALGNPTIEEITARYRKYMLLFFGGVTFLFFGLVYFILWPLNRVINSIEGRKSNRSVIIKNPNSVLERAFNQLARDATLTRFSKQLRDEVAAKGLSYAEPLLQRVPDLVTQLVELPGTQVWILTRREERDPWEVEKVHSGEIPWACDEAFQGRLLEEIAKAEEAGALLSLQGRMLHFRTGQGRPLNSFCDLLDATYDRLRVFIIHLPPRSATPSEEEQIFFSRLAIELRYALGTVEEQRRLILQEKSKANISLSRNLGHDLTNIIATSKLELMTVRAFLSLSPEEVAQSPAKAAIFRESLEALLNNTRFLQEIVNIYRSFSYLQKPNFEEVDINALVRDVVQLYELSLSNSYPIETNLSKSKIPPVRVEPRLLRLALFNLLNNSTDSIKKMDGEQKHAGKVILTTSINRKRGFVEVRVEDNGPGIRDGKGNLLAPDQISEIFRLGYTTKDNQEGEGLGLNWVQSIVREFHRGEITARNRDDGGAMFSLRIPLNDSAEGAPSLDSGSAENNAKLVGQPAGGE